MKLSILYASLQFWHQKSIAKDQKKRNSMPKKLTGGKRKIRINKRRRTVFRFEITHIEICKIQCSSSTISGKWSPTSEARLLRSTPRPFVIRSNLRRTSTRPKQSMQEPRGTDGRIRRQRKPSPD